MRNRGGLQLHKLVFLPVAGFVLLFLVIVVILDFKRSYQSRKEREAVVATDVRENSSYFGQEIYLGQVAAYETRLGLLETSIARKIGEARVCTRLVLQSSILEGNGCRNEHQNLEGNFSHQVLVGSSEIARIQVEYPARVVDWSALSGLVGPLLFALLGAAGLQWVLVSRVFTSVVLPLSRNLAEKEKFQAIASTTQALAHDIRKPFSMFKSIIQIVEGTEDPEEVREVLKVTLPEVNQAMASVEGMIQDVMQIGADSKLILEDAAPETLVEAALGDLFRVHPNADVSLEYAFTHRNMAQADSVRLGRVFANILGNAVQAMREKGSLWIRTVERAGFVEFTLGNAGSVIPAESLPKLFDAFFTSGKKGGTGLGLAIAKKIVEAHGGTIFCRSEKNDSHPKGMVEFVFTLPASNAACSPRSDALPTSSREIQAAFSAVRIAAQRQASPGPDPREAEIEAHLVARLDALRAPEAGLATASVTVLVVDDEAVYRNGLLALLERSEALAQRVRMVFARNNVEAFAAVKEHVPVLLIEDVDLGPTSKDGLEIVRRLRESGFKGQICVHSNRFLAGDSRAALAAGADAVLPKPMGRAHLLKLILASLPEPQAAAAAVEHAPTAPPRKLNVAMLDDSLSMRLAWKMELGDETSFRAFASTTTFFDTCEREPAYFASLDVVVTDYNFSPGDPHDGGTFARELRARGYEGLVLRASGETDLGPEIEILFDGDVGKAALEWPDFQRAVATAQSAKVGRVSRC